MHDYILNTCYATISRKYYMPELVGEFYFSVRKKRSMDESDIRGDTENTSPNDNYYKNSSLKSGWAALHRYFKGKRGLDITSNVNFIQANEIFQAVIQQGKVERCGETCAKIPISDPDMSKLSSYILENIKEPPPKCSETPRVCAF